MGDRARRQYIRHCDNRLITCLSECAGNLIKGNVKLTDRQMKTLKRKRYDLRSLAKKSASIKSKRQILQKGGFLAALIPPVVSALAGLLLSRKS